MQGGLDDIKMVILRYCCVRRARLEGENCRCFMMVMLLTGDLASISPPKDGGVRFVYVTFAACILFLDYILRMYT